MNLRKITSEILSEGGVTYSLRYGKVSKKGYAASPYKARELVIPVKEFGDNDVRNFTLDNGDLLSLHDHALGAWVEDGQVYLDVVQVVTSKAKATAICRANEQKAFFDLENSHTIYV